MNDCSFVGISDGQCQDRDLRMVWYRNAELGGFSVYMALQEKLFAIFDRIYVALV